MLQFLRQVQGNFGLFLYYLVFVFGWMSFFWLFKVVLHFFSLRHYMIQELAYFWVISLYRIYLCENAHRDMHMYMQKSKKHNTYMHKSNPLIRNVRTTQTLELKRSVCVCVSSEQEQEKRGLFARKIAHVYATLTGRLCVSDKQHYLFVRIGFVCAQKPDNFHLGHNWEDLRHLLRGVNLFQFKHSEFGVECHEIVARSNIWKKFLSKVLDCLWIKLNT